MLNSFNPFKSTGPRVSGYVIGLSALLTVCAGFADDWPTYRHDNARSGVSAEALPEGLSLDWTFTPSAPPQPAWSDPEKEKPRTQFDEVFHVSVMGDAAFFGSSADGKVYCLDAATGEIRWSALTGGPIRVAPTVSEGRVYVGSDDGCAYCFKAADGALVWRVPAAWRDERVLGNGRMISLWPVRTGVLVADGNAYFGAGVFPHETLFLCAVKADTGEMIWRNDTYGEQGYTLEFGGISPQGPLLATETTLFVPSGRAMPAAFKREDGSFITYLSPGGKVGGTWALLDEGRLVSGTEMKRSYDAQKGTMVREAVYAWFPGLNLVVTENAAYMTTFDSLLALDRNAFALAEKQRKGLDRRRKPLEDKCDALKKKHRDADKDEKEALRPEIAALEEKLAQLNEEQRILEQSVQRWSRPCALWDGMILAGKTLFLGGAKGVKAVNSETGEDCWAAPLTGRACGLAASNGRLFVSSDTGEIHCFSAQGAAKQAKPAPPAVSWPNDPDEPDWGRAAEDILAQTGVKRGFCLIYGSGSGRLAYELAQRSELMFIGVDADPGQVALARANLDAAGLYGARITLDAIDLSSLPQASYFANLVVSETMIRTGQSCGTLDQIKRMTKPCGGVICLPAKAIPADWSVAEGEFSLREGPADWKIAVRGALPGAGKWTHQYADPANTACSDDQLVQGALGVLWYGAPGPSTMVERHARSVAPVSMDGRLFVQGENRIMAYDAYNGMRLWEREIPGAVRVRADSDMSNLALSREALYVATGSQCLALNPENGETIQTFTLPSSPEGSGQRWGYLATLDGLLYGSCAPALLNEYGNAWEVLVDDDGEWADLTPETTGKALPEEYKQYLQKYRAQFPKPSTQAFWNAQQTGFMWHSMNAWPAWNSIETPVGSVTERMMASKTFFAMDAKSGALRWRYDGGEIGHPAIALDQGVVFLADCGVTESEKQAALEERRGLIEKGTWENDTITYRPEDADVRRVVALDAATGQKRWERVMDLTGCGGDRMGLSCKNGVLCFFGYFSNHDRDLFLTGKLAWRRITALNAADGTDKWSRPLNYLRRPVIVGNEILIEPRACDLQTGAVKQRIHPLTGAESTWEYVRPGHCCSATSAAPNMFFLRGYFLWYYDLLRDQGMLPFGGIRPGCWINTIPANGLVLFPEASAGCTCSYPIRATVALQPKPSLRTYSVCVQHGDQTPVQRMGILLGAPGDWRDTEGKMWFAYPHPPSTRWHQYGITFDLKEEWYDQGGFFCRNFQGMNTKNTDKPWLFSAGGRGMKRCSIPLLDPGQGPGVYTVRLFFSAQGNPASNTTVFSIKLQDKEVAKAVNIAQEAGGLDGALVKEFSAIQVQDALVLELVMESGAPAPDGLPVLNGLELLREDKPVAAVMNNVVAGRAE